MQITAEFYTRSKKLIELNEDINKSTTFIGKFQIPLSVIAGRRQKISKDMGDQNNTTEQLDFTVTDEIL